MGNPSVRADGTGPARPNAGFTPSAAETGRSRQRPNSEHASRSLLLPLLRGAIPRARRGFGRLVLRVVRPQIRVGVQRARRAVGSPHGILFAVFTRASATNSEQNDMP